MKFFRCIGCKSSYSPEKIRRCPVMRCPKCNSALDAEYDYKSIQHTIRKDEFMRECPGHWKYWDAHDSAEYFEDMKDGEVLVMLAKVIPQPDNH